MTVSSLRGRTVLLTRANEDAAPWARALQARGARTLTLPCITSEPIDDRATSAALARALASSDWLAVQSQRGVQAVHHLMASGLPAATRVAVVGPATAHAAARWLGRVDLIAMPASSEGLARTLLARAAVHERRVVIAAAEGGRTDARDVLVDAGFDVRYVPVYRTIPAPPAGTRFDPAAERVDVIVLASPTAVTGLLNQALPSEARIVTIGPATSEAARAAGLRVAAEARRPDLEGIMEAIA